MTLKPISIKATDEEKAAWKAQAEKYGTTVSALIRQSMNALSQGAIDPPPVVPIPQESSLPTQTPDMAEAVG